MQGKDQELLSAYLDGELTPGQTRDISDRLAADPELRAEYMRLQHVSAALQVRLEPDPAFIVRHRQRREDLSPVPFWTWRQLGSRLSAAAAALLVASGLSVWQAERPEVETLVDTASVAEELDLLALEGEILASPEFQTLAATDRADEPVLLIALGGGFAPAGER